MLLKFNPTCFLEVDDAQSETKYTGLEKSCLSDSFVVLLLVSGL